MAAHRKQKSQTRKQPWEHSGVERRRPAWVKQQLCSVEDFSPQDLGWPGEMTPFPCDYDTASVRLPDGLHCLRERTSPHSFSDFLEGGVLLPGCYLQQVLRLLEGVLGKPRGSEVGCQALPPARMLPSVTTETLWDLATTYSRSQYPPATLAHRLAAPVHFQG